MWKILTTQIRGKKIYYSIENRGQWTERMPLWCKKNGVPIIHRSTHSQGGYGPVRWGCTTHRLHFCRGVRIPQRIEGTVQCELWPNDSWTLVKFLGVWIVIKGPNDEELFALRPSQVLWASKFLINLKIWLLFGNVLKLNFPPYFAWTILKDLVS